VPGLGRSGLVDPRAADVPRPAAGPESARPGRPYQTRIAAAVTGGAEALPLILNICLSQAYIGCCD
jgi:hypothetical protein